MAKLTYRGGCLCGGIKYEISSEIKFVTHCHCSMCRKAHGAAFGTYGSVLCEGHRFIQGENLLSQYQSSESVTRKFCSVCGSPMIWQSSGQLSGWISFPLGTLETPYLAPKQKHIYVASKAPWYDIKDQWPQED